MTRKLPCWWLSRRLIWSLRVNRLRWWLSTYLITAGFDIAPAGQSKKELRFMLARWDRLVKENAPADGADTRRARWRLGPVAEASDD